MLIKKTKRIEYIVKDIVKDGIKDFRHTISIIWNPICKTYKLEEWYLNGKDEYTKTSFITDKIQIKICRQLFNKV